MNLGSTFPPWIFSDIRVGVNCNPKYPSIHPFACPSMHPAPHIPKYSHSANNLKHPPFHIHCLPTYLPTSFTISQIPHTTLKLQWFPKQQQLQQQWKLLCWNHIPSRHFETWFKTIWQNGKKLPFCFSPVNWPHRHRRHHLHPMVLVPFCHLYRNLPN